MPRLPLALCLAATPALAGQPLPFATPNLAEYATAAQLATAMTPCPAVPLADTLNGTVGTGSPCMIRPDAARPTVVQAANVSTDANGLWSVTWAKSFVSAAPIVNPLPLNTGTLPIMCNVQARTATAASGKCWQANTSTLPGTLTALSGLILNTFSSGAANTPVMVIAREPTQ